MSRPTYKGSQQDLYSVARTGWNSCNTYLLNFSTVRTRYTPEYIKERLEEIDNAELLPDEDRREEESRLSRIRLEEKAAESLSSWRLLRNYIIDAFPVSEHETRLDACGQGHYRKAARNEWASVQRLVVDGAEFIETNESDLIKKGHMPDKFRTGFITLRDDFAAAHQRFLDTSSHYGVQTQDKIKANNEVHAQLMKMFRDGQEIFRNDEAVKKLFTFDQVALTVSGPGVQGLKGEVTQPENLPVPGAQVAFTGPTNKTVITDEEGRYDCPQLKEGMYSVTITATGYDPLTINNVEVADGVMKVVDFVLVKSQ